jgi:hypothetical protein
MEREKKDTFFNFKCCGCICVFVYIKILLCVNIGLTGKIEENISIKIIQMCMYYDHIWLHLLKDLNLNWYDHIWNLFSLPGMTCCPLLTNGEVEVGF